MNKIFGIGMGRTATRSLTKALEVLGYNIMHYPSDDDTMLHIQNGYFKLPVLEVCDGLTDTVAVPYYAQFDTLYPGSKFILTVREVESWLKSVRKNHNEESDNPLNRNERMSDMRKFYRAVCWGTYRYNRERYTFVYDQHNRNVMEYFRDRPGDLLVMDICGGQGWEVLCPFLDRDIPPALFPREGTGTAAAESLAGMCPKRFSYWEKIKSAIGK